MYNDLSWHSVNCFANIALRLYLNLLLMFIIDKILVELNMSNTTLFIAKMLAPYFMVTGLGFIISKDFYYRILNDSNSEQLGFLNLSGMVHFAIGLAVILTHFDWSNHLAIVVTLLSLSFLLKGGLLIVIPNIMLAANKITNEKLLVSGIVFIALSLYLGWFAYMPNAFT